MPVRHSWGRRAAQGWYKKLQESECGLVEWHWWKLGGYALWPQVMEKKKKKASPLGDDTYTSHQLPNKESLDNSLLTWPISPGSVACCNCLIYNLKTSKQLICQHIENNVDGCFDVRPTPLVCVGLNTQHLKQALHGVTSGLLWNTLIDPFCLEYKYQDALCGCVCVYRNAYAAVMNMNQCRCHTNSNPLDLPLMSGTCVTLSHSYQGQCILLIVEKGKV